MEDLQMLDAAGIEPVITRLSPPGNWDMLPKGTIIKVIDTDIYDEEFYIQRSSDTTKPLWEKI